MVAGNIGNAARRLQQRPLAQAWIKNRLVKGLISARVELGYDMATSTASITIATQDAPFWTEEDGIRVDMGYGGSGGALMTAFAGVVESDNRKYSPRMLEVSASGHAKKLQRPYGNTALVTDPPSPAFVYASQTDTQIWNDVMRRAGVPRYDAGEGDGITYGTQKAYEVAVGTKLGDIVSKLDESSKNGQRTFEIAGHVFRRPVLGVPSASVAWKYAEGLLGLSAPYLPIIDITRNVSDKDIQNQAVVKGVSNASESDQTSIPVMATIQAVNDKLGKDGEGNDIYVPHSLSSDFLESRAQCVDVAKRYMIEFNKETDDLTLRVALNPGIFPGQSIGITSQKMDLGSERPYWVRHVSHEWGSSGGFTSVQLEGGAGAEGLLVGLPPVASFEMSMTSEFFEVGGVADTWYTVTADATTSFDPDGNIVSYAWTATNGASGSGVTWATRFNQAQWDDPDTTITLTVTDDNTGPGGARTNSLTQNVTAATGDTGTQTDGLYVAGGARADASADAGATWGTWTADAGATVTCVTRLSPGLALFGLSDGRLMLTEDHLASAPTLQHTFPAAVTAVWIHEADNQKVAIGLANGDFWITKDAFTTAPILKRNFTHPINWINGSVEQMTQWRIATGSYVWITYDDATTVGTLSTQANTVEQIELSNFANYNVENVDANIKIESVGVSLTYPALSPAPTRARLAHFLRTDELMVADDQSRAFVKAAGTNALSAVTAIAGGAVNALMASRTNPKVFYAGTVDGLYKTYDAGLTWYRVRAYTDAGLDALQLGLDSEPVTIKQVAAQTEFWSGGPTTAYGVGGLNYLIPNDGSGPEIATEVTQAMRTGNGVPKGKSWLIDNSTPNPPESEEPNFWLLSYDDTAWEPVIFNGGGYSYEALPRAWTMSPVRDPTHILDTDMYMLFRHVFTPETPAQPYLRVLLSALGRKQIVKMWFNGTQIHGAGAAARPIPTESKEVPFGAAELDGVYRIDVTDLILPGEPNIIAAYVISRHIGITPGYLEYRLMLNTAPTLSISTSGPGYFFATTSEESRAMDLFNDANFATYPNGHSGITYLDAPPDGWTNQTFDDSGWPFGVGPLRVDIGHAGNIHSDELIVSLLHGSQWLGVTWNTPGPAGAGFGSAIRQHWAVPDGTYTTAKIDLRWRHKIRVWLNGTLVYQNESDFIPTVSISVDNKGTLHETLDIDVLSALKPGEDNVLCIQVWRDDIYPKSWFPGDFIGACAIMEVS